MRKSVGGEAMPETLGFRNVGVLERQRVDAVLGREFPRHFFSRAAIGVRIVVQRIVEIEEHQLDAAHQRTRYCGGVNCIPAIFPCPSTAKTKSTFVPFAKVSRYTAYG